MCGSLRAGCLAPRRADGVERPVGHSPDSQVPAHPLRRFGAETPTREWRHDTSLIWMARCRDVDCVARPRTLSGDPLIWRVTIRRPIVDSRRLSAKRDLCASSPCHACQTRAGSGDGRHWMLGCWVTSCGSMRRRRPRAWPRSWGRELTSRSTAARSDRECKRVQLCVVQVESQTDASAGQLHKLVGGGKRHGVIRHVLLDRCARGDFASVTVHNGHQY